MKSLFAVSLLTAFALAQTGLPVELNEDGKLELTIPRIPKIEFTDIKIDDIRVWAEGT